MTLDCGLKPVRVERRCMHGVNALRRPEARGPQHRTSQRRANAAQGEHVGAGRNGWAQRSSGAGPALSGPARVPAWSRPVPAPVRLADPAAGGSGVKRGASAQKPGPAADR